MIPVLLDSLGQLADLTSRLTIDDVFSTLVREFPEQVTFSTSFSQEDQVITHLLLRGGYPVPIFTLDTGRIFPETYAVWNATNERYATRILPFNPENDQLEAMLAAKGPNSFYESVENRKECCYLRKVLPLRRAIAGMGVWITGLRAEHSDFRRGLTPLEWDPVNHLFKYHPLVSWSTAAVQDFIKEHNIPYNTLYDRGFASIGCQPCTRAIAPGEELRAGRWWWEQSQGKECGLHVQPADQNHA